MNRELIAPDAPVDRGSPLASTMIRVGSWPLHGSSYLRSIASCAGASPAAAPAAALTARAGGPARGHPAAAPVTRTLRAAGLFPGGMLAVRRAREPGHSAAARPANQATGFQPPTGMSLVTVPSSPARQEPRQRGVVSSPAIRAGGVSLASAGGSDVWLSCSAAPANSPQTGAAPTKTGPGGRPQGAIPGAIGGRYRAAQGDVPRQFVQLNAL
jgi:hypothetical protein